MGSTPPNTFGQVFPRRHLWLNAPFALNRPLAALIKWDEELSE